MLAIDAKTGPMLWYNRLIKHTIYDWDTEGLIALQLKKQE